MLHLLFANYVIKLFELMVVVCLKRHRMQVDSYIYNVNKLVKTKVQFHLIFQVFPQSPSLRLFFHQKSPLSKLKYCKHFTVGSNFSYGKLFRDMFPDSHIAKGYKQSETKIKHFIQSGQLYILYKPSRMIFLVQHFHLSLMGRRLK